MVNAEFFDNVMISETRRDVTTLNKKLSFGPVPLVPRNQQRTLFIHSTANLFMFINI